MTRKVALRRALRGRETFYGNVENTEDALRIIGACSEGLLKRATVRLAAEECTSLRPGSVFVFDEEESGIKRWTDGKVWSPSRILGNWLVYRELERKIGRRAGGGPSCSGVPKELKNSGLQVIGSTKGTFVVKGQGGLIKKTFSVPNGSSTTHLVVYLPNEHSPSHNLLRPSGFQELARVHVRQESAQAQRFRRRKSSPASSSRRARKSASSKQRISSKRALDDEMSDVDSDQTEAPSTPKRRPTLRPVPSSSDVDSDQTETPSIPKRRPILRPVPARANRGVNFYREGDTASESSSGSEYVTSDAKQDAVDSSPGSRQASLGYAVPEPTKDRVPVRRMFVKSTATVPVTEPQDNDKGATQADVENRPEGPEIHDSEGDDHQREYPDQGEDSYGGLQEEGGLSCTTRSAIHAKASDVESASVEYGALDCTTSPQASPTSAANLYSFDSDADYEESLLSGNTAHADIGSEDSSFIVEYMCSRGYSHHQFITPSFEPDLPMLEA